MGYLPYSDEIEAAIARLRAVADRAVRGRHHVGLRAALPALDRAVPKGGPKTAASCNSSTSPRDDLEVPGEPYTSGR